MKSVEKWGVDVDTAVELALKDLQLTKEEVEVEVLEESSNGFLGIGSKLAKVKVTPLEDVKVASKEKAKLDDIDAILASLPENSAKELPEEVRAEYDKYEQEEKEDAFARNDNVKEKRYDINLEDVMLEEVKALSPVENHKIEIFLKNVFEQMGLELSVEVKANDKIVFADIEGKDTGTIIGKRGATLDAIQCLCGYVVNRGEENYIRVVLDTENYRSKRETTLINLANRLASKVERTGRSVALEPMNPYERKVIHSTLQANPNVVTKSAGKDPYRKVVIELSK